MTETRAKYVAWSAALVLSLQILAVCVYLFYPAFPAMAAAVIPVGLLVVGIMMRSRLAWWVGAVIFGVMGLAHAIGFLVQVSDPLLTALTGRHPLFGWDPVHSTGIALLRLGSLILVGLYLTPSVRRHCDRKLNRTTVAGGVALAGVPIVGILLVVLPFGGRGVGPRVDEGKGGVLWRKHLVQELAPQPPEMLNDQIVDELRGLEPATETEPQPPTEWLAERLEEVAPRHPDDPDGQGNPSLPVQFSSSQQKDSQSAVVEEVFAATEAFRKHEAIDKEQDKQTTRLDDAVLVRVLGTRSWTPPEPKFQIQERLPDGKYASLFLTSTGQTRANFGQTVAKPEMPEGRYVEILVVFENTGDKPVRVPLSSESGSLDVRLALRNKDVLSPADFLPPFTNWGDPSELKRLHKKGLTIANDFVGRIEVQLNGNEKTWLILLFDVPDHIVFGDLRITDAAPIRVRW